MILIPFTSDTSFRIFLINNLSFLICFKEFIYHIIVYESATFQLAIEIFYVISHGIWRHIIGVQKIPAPGPEINEMLLW